MGELTVQILDVSGSRRREAKVPDDVQVQRLIVLLVERMELPLNSPDGQIMSYKLHHRSTGRQLLDNQTLADAQVEEGAELRLQPEIIAGAAIATEERYSRFSKIKWWDQNLLTESKVLVVGAGALGNEVLKNLALLGVGHLIVVDFDLVETSNLSRSVLFRPGDEGKPKAEVAELAIRELSPHSRVLSLTGPLQSVLGLGYFRWADVVVGAVDNREARVFINTACAKVGRPWFDAGIDVLDGVVRGFWPPETPCYECTMSKADWDELERRRSCALLARAAGAEGGVPTTPTTASILGGIQAQEVVKYLHQKAPLLGRGFFFEGLNHSSYSVTYSQNPDCPWHEELVPVHCAEEMNLGHTLGDVWRLAESKIGTLSALELSRELVSVLDCPKCQIQQPYWKPLAAVTEGEVACQKCAQPMNVSFLSSIYADSEILNRTLKDIGIPPADVVWARSGENYLGIQVGLPDRLPS